MPSEDHGRAAPLHGPSRTSVRTITVSVVLAVAGAAFGYLVTAAQNTASDATGTPTSSGSQPSWFGLLFVVLIIVRPVFEIISWLFRTYTVYPTELVIDEGVFTQHHRVLPFARVQQVDLHQPFVSQLLGISVVRVSTAGEAGATTVALHSLDRSEAERLRAYILLRREELQHRPGLAGENANAGVGAATAGMAGQPPTPGAPPPPDQVLLRLGSGQLAMAALTHGSVVVGTPVALIVGLWIAVLTATNTDDLQVAGMITLALACALGAAALLVIARLFTMLVGHYGFTLSSQGADLHLRFGLFEVRQLTIPRRRVQQIIVEDNPLRRVLGAVSVDLHSATGAGGSQASTRFEIPLLPRAQLDDFLRSAMGDERWQIPTLVERTDRARSRGVRRRAALLALAVAGPAIALRPAGLVLFVVAVLGVPWGAVAHRRAGHQVTASQVVFGHGVLRHRLELLPLARVQSCHSRSSPFQRRADLTSFHCDIAADRTAPRLYDMDATTARDLLARIPRQATGQLSDLVP